MLVVIKVQEPILGKWLKVVEEWLKQCTLTNKHIGITIKQTVRRGIKSSNNSKDKGVDE